MNETKSQDKISVIVPVYNTAPYLKRCLDSVRQSTYQNLEIICVNDGSTDESLSILESYRMIDKRIVVIDQNNKGISAVKNIGIAQATGDFVSFVDSDDWVHPQMFEVLRNAMTEDVCLAVCKPRFVYHQEPMELLDSAPQLQVYPSLSEAYQNTTIRYYSWGRLFPKAMVTGLYYDQELSLGEDTLFNLKLVEKPGKCVFVEEMLYFYYQRDTSLVHTASWKKSAGMVEKFIQSAKEEDTILQGVIYEDAIKKAFAYRYAFMFDKENKQVAKTARTSIREAVNEMRRNRLTSKKKIAVYTIMNHFPILYRIYRIALDPTLLGWEKKQKELNKET